MQIKLIQIKFEVSSKSQFYSDIRRLSEKLYLKKKKDYKGEYGKIKSGCLLLSSGVEART